MKIEFFEGISENYEEYEAQTMPGVLLLGETTQQESIPISQGSSFSTQLWGALLVVMLVIALAYFAVRMTGRGKRGRNSGNLKIVEAIGVSPQSTVQLIQAGDKYFLVGVSRQGITAIGEVDAESIKDDDTSSLLPEMPFEKYLARFTKKKEEPPKES